MAKTYRSIFTSNKGNNKHQAELKSKAKRREARAARRQYDWRVELDEEQWLLDEQNHKEYKVSMRWTQADCLLGTERN